MFCRSRHPIRHPTGCDAMCLEFTQHIWGKCMPVSIPRSLRQRISDEIAEGLTASGVSSGAALQLHARLWELHGLIAQGSRVDQQLVGILGDQHLSAFVVNEAYQKDVGPWRHGHPTEPFIDAIGADAPHLWAEQILSSLESLPWEYHAYIRFAGQLDSAIVGPDGLYLTPSLALVRSSLVPDLPPHATTPSLAGLLGAPPSRRSEDSLYLRLSFEGYVSRDRDSVGVNQIIASVLSIYGIALSLRLFFHNPWQLSERNLPPYGIEIFRRTDAEETYTDKFSLDPSHSKELGRLVHLSAATPEATHLRALSLLSAVGNAMSRASSRLLNAARWYFDSHCGYSDQVRFVQVCISLEILLGDEKQGRETGLSLLMANRCAYLLGTNNAERETITTGFKRGYDIRSKIVHAGKSQLSSEEKNHLHYMQHLCSAVIRKECQELEQ